MLDGIVADRDKWMQIARELVEEFKAVKGFFPSEKARRITWFDEDVGVVGGEQRERGEGGGFVGRYKKRVRQVDEIEMRVEEMQSRLLEGMEGVGTSTNLHCLASLLSSICSV